MKRENAEIAAIALIEILFIAFVYFESWLGIANRWMLAIVSLLAAGIIIKKIGGFGGWEFVYLIGSQRGLKTMDNISKKHARLWNSLAVWSLVLSFGFLSYPLFRKKISIKAYAVGIVSLVAILMLVLPYLAFAMPFIQLPQLQNALASSSSAPYANYLAYANEGISIFTGFAGYVVFSLAYNAAAILKGIGAYAITISSGNPNISLARSQMPGVAPLIPGIDTPLIAGILSLAVLLIIHEGSHGIVARSMKVKLKSTGLLILGIIPMGAYVEPDEKMISKLEGFNQTKIFSAGISANFAAMIIFFLLMLPLLYFVVPNIIQVKGVYISGTMQGYPASNVLKAGMQVLYWDGHKISNLTGLENAAANDKPGSVVTVTTNTGTYTFDAIGNSSTGGRGYIGVTLEEKTEISHTLYGTVMYFVYTFVALSFLLNFLVGAVNLLPLPGFDGWRIYETNIKSKKFVNALAYVVVAALLINLFQWVFFL